jgi:hypothetical protein
MNEQVTLYEQAIPWIGLALLLVLCLPFVGIQKLVLEVYGWGLRLALLALLFTATYLWFHPEQLPVEVTDTLNNVPLLKALLPESGSPFFGICVAAAVVALLLPVLAVLDVCRMLAGRRLRRLCILATGPGAEASPRSVPATQREPRRAPRRIDRWAAADTMAEVASRQPLRPADRLAQ